LRGERADADLASVVNVGCGLAARAFPAAVFRAAGLKPWYYTHLIGVAGGREVRAYQNQLEGLPSWPRAQPSERAVALAARVTTQPTDTAPRHSNIKILRWVLKVPGHDLDCLIAE